VSALYGLWFRPRLLTWGATEDEARGGYPGDELVPDATGSSTMAATLPAPPERVWPWLVQMGWDRGGWYSWDWLDHYGKPSADRIVPEWQQLAEGQRLTASRNGLAWFTVAVVEPNRTLVLRSNLELPSGHSFDPRSAFLPRAYLDGIWAFHLRPVRGGGTRLVVRTRGRSHPRRLTLPFDLLLGEPGHFLMQTRQFQNLRTRVGPGAAAP
jgi:proline iminopeptidase